MHRWKYLLWGLTAFVLIAVGCGGGDQEPAGDTDQQAVTPQKQVDPATVGAITGKVNFTGARPKASRLRMNADPECVKRHTQPVVSEEVVVNDNGTLRNVFVYVKQGLEDYAFPTPEQPAILSQKGCIYHPHVSGMQAGQPLDIVNSDPTLHNIHALPEKNPQFNIGQPVPMTTTKTFKNPEVMIHFKCDVHSWMSAYLGVLPHPYFATTGEDGTFELNNLPPGEYVIEAWHEKYGTVTQTITLGTKETKTIEFTYPGQGV